MKTGQVGLFFAVAITIFLFIVGSCDMSGEDNSRAGCAIDSRSDYDTICTFAELLAASDRSRVGSVSSLGPSGGRSEGASQNYALGSDIDGKGATFAPFASKPSGQGDATTRCLNRCYGGTFDGKGYTIKNIEVRASDVAGAQDIGFIGYLSGTVHDVIFENITVHGKSVGDSGVIAGYNFGTIYNVGVKNSRVNGGGSNGGIVGDNVNSLSHAYATDVRIECGGSSGGKGGVVGATSKIVRNIYATGSFVIRGSTCNHAGGVVGTLNGDSLEASYAAMSMPSGTVTNSGGVIGLSSDLGKAVTKPNKTPYWDTTVGGATNCGTFTLPPDIPAGSIAKAAVCAPVGLTTAELKSTSGTYPNELGAAFLLREGKYPGLCRRGGACTSAEHLLAGQQ